MNATEAAQMARDHFYGVPGMLPDLGFETINIFHLDWNEWEVECSVFSLLTSKMTKYRVIISDDKVESIRRLIE
jgi:hypothetical protein